MTQTTEVHEDGRRSGAGDGYVVGIGASAGGLESLERFFDAAPPDTNMAFVVILHLAPNHQSLMIELLAKHTQMRVRAAETGQLVEANTVYVLQPGQLLEVRERRFILSDRIAEHGRPPFAIDFFLRSLAVDYHDHAAAIVVSGTGSDGSAGAAAVKDAGGFVIAEDPGTAKFNGMPRSAIDTGKVDRVLAPEDMPAELMRHVGILEPVSVPTSPLQRILEVIGRHSSISFERYKSGTIARRVDRRRLTLECEQLEDYAAILDANVEEREQLVQDLLVGVSAFFRDPDAFQSLRASVPSLLAACQERNEETLRIWVAGCSTGEEAYSIAMVMAEALERSPSQPQIKIFATDVNRHSIEFSGRGVYPSTISNDIDPRLLKKYFSPRPDGWEIAKSIREMIVFAQHDILKDPPFTKVGLVSCRNLLIYLDSGAQRQAFETFRFSLRDGGLLFLGSSETPSGGRDFRPVSEKHRLYQYLGSPRGGAVPLRTEPRPAAAPSLPGGEAIFGNDGEQLMATWVPPALSDRYLESLINWSGLPAIIADPQDEVLFSFGSANRLLTVPAGRAAMRLADLLPEPLVVLLSAAKERLQGEAREVTTDNLVLDGEDGPLFEGAIKAVRLDSSRRREPAFAYVFETLRGSESREGGSRLGMEDAVRDRIRQIEFELLTTRERLQATVEELETSNEELQASNEELVSSNEELQSTNEELQSLNEELHTVNSELQEKVVELSALTDDLDNLLQNVDTGLLFLDLDGRVRRFSDPVTSVVRILDEDIGRPIGHLAHRFLDVDLEREFRSVFTSFVGVERQLRTTDHRTYRLRVQPFRTRDMRVEGVVMTTSDITAAIDAGNRLAVHSAANDCVASPLIIADTDGTIEFVNAAFSKLVGFELEAVLARRLTTLLADSESSQFSARLDEVGSKAEDWSGEVLLMTRSEGPLSATLKLHPHVGASGGVDKLIVTLAPLP